MGSRRYQIDVRCYRCGKKFTRNLSKAYIREDGTTMLSSYCKSCQQVGKKKNKPRTTAEIIGERDYENYGVKVYTREEIAAYVAAISCGDKTCPDK